MTRPVFDEESRFAEAYTAEDRAAGTQGMVIVACDVLRSGVVKRCQLIKGLPGVGPRLLELMETLHAKPATRQGQPVSVRYLKVFNFQPRPM